ncbi:UNVERIFIED_CONTAM: hypothetical protein RMT77_004732 [Armadillidium vulgare]
MNIISFVLTLICLNLIEVNSYGSISSQKSNPSIEESEIINAIQEFGRKISHAQWSKKPNDNVVLSPLSITTILNLLMLGTTGQSNLELHEAVGYPNGIEERAIHETFRQIFASLQQSGSGVHVSSNTRLFPQEGFHILESYKNVCDKSYSTKVQNLDFRGSPNVAIEKINSWVANSTQGKIKKLFLEPLDPNTVFVACNVIFLNAKWVNKFDSRLTRNGIFYTGNENITNPMMTSDMRVPYARDDKSRFEIVSLPYEGNRYSMYILRPIDNAGISDLIQLEKTLNPDYLNSLIDQMTTERLLVTLPRMRLYQDLDLKVDLKSLGVDQIFSERLANFERLSDKQGLFVSDIFHKAVLEVTEEGTSAAAVTASVISPTSLPGRFIVDKPSLLFIRDNKNGLILFWAKVIKPEKLTA